MNTFVSHSLLIAIVNSMITQCTNMPCADLISDM